MGTAELREDVKWEDSQGFRVAKAKKEKGERVRSFLKSSVYKEDILPYCNSQMKAALSRSVQAISDHATLASCLAWNQAHQAMLDALEMTAKDADLDISVPTEEDESPIVTP